MADHIVRLSETFWNIRGSFKILGLINVQTQSSLVRLQSGRFVLLDCYTLEGDIREQIMDVTEGGDLVDAIINLHPFHTIHVKRVQRLFPNAKLYGTERHQRRAPGLPWEAERTESEAFAELFAEDFDFRVPQGVELIPSNENLHFGSVLAIHKQSQTLHVDDTLNYMPWPFRRLSFHPTLAKVLLPHASAADEFRQWANELIARCESVSCICTAHAALPPNGRVDSVAEQVRAALAKVEPTLRKHARSAA